MQVLQALQATFPETQRNSLNGTRAAEKAVYNQPDNNDYGKRKDIPCNPVVRSKGSEKT
jgi:hypothetical protein